VLSATFCSLLAREMLVSRTPRTFTSADGRGIRIAAGRGIFNGVDYAKRARAIGEPVGAKVLLDVGDAQARCQHGGIVGFMFWSTYLYISEVSEES